MSFKRHMRAVVYLMVKFECKVILCMTFPNNIFLIDISIHIPLSDIFHYDNNIAVACFSTTYRNVVFNPCRIVRRRFNRSIYDRVNLVSVNCQARLLHLRCCILGVHCVLVSIVRFVTSNRFANSSSYCYKAA
jgi:hypothetical protein